METTINKCNNCGKISEDVYSEIGWIKFRKEGGIPLSIYNGRKSDGAANTERYYRGHDNFDFCSLECFLRWLYLSKNTENKGDLTDYNDPFYNEIKDILNFLETRNR